MTQKVFPCWKCGKDVGQIQATFLQARWSEDGKHREYAHKDADKRCQPDEEK